MTNPIQPSSHSLPPSSSGEPTLNKSCERISKFALSNITTNPPDKNFHINITEASGRNCSDLFSAYGD